MSGHKGAIDIAQFVVQRLGHGLDCDLTQYYELGGVDNLVECSCCFRTVVGLFEEYFSDHGIATPLWGVDV